MKKNYKLELHKTTEWIICDLDELGIRNFVARCNDETMAKDILELLTTHKRPSEKKKVTR